ncbi:MAG: hypothetical protein AAFO69_06445 [Bacteroidota bacterium]
MTTSTSTNNTSTEATQYLQSHDQILADIIDNSERVTVDSTSDVFFDLVTCILEQQIHYRARGVYLRKLMELTNGILPTPEIIRMLDPYDFVMKKIARNKYDRLQRLAEHWVDNGYEEVEWALQSNDTVREKLGDIKGVGQWTINMILLYTLGRPDIFDPNDYQLKKVMMATYGLADDKRLTIEMTSIADRWRPHRSTAVLYLLSWREKMKQKR